MSDENLGSQTNAEQTAIQTERERNTEAELENTLNGSIGLTVVMAVFAAVIILVYGFEAGDGMTVSVTAIGLSVIVCGFKWFLEIKNQRRWKKAERKKVKVSDRHVL